MFPGLDLAFIALAETHYRRTVLYPALIQRAQHQRERRRPAWQQVARWRLGTAFVRLGEHLRTPAAAGRANTGATPHNPPYSATSPSLRYAAAQN
ncbi:MAG: hypothetical protein AB7R89_34125 [Dehalococcoidia bacterium]